MSVNIAPLLRGMWEIVDALERRVADLESEKAHLQGERNKLIAEEVFSDRCNRKIC